LACCHLFYKADVADAVFVVVLISVLLLLQSQDLSAVGASTSSSASLGDVMTSSVVASILHRRRPQVTLTLDSAPRYSPPAPGPSRRSSASIDSGYGSSVTASPTLPILDIFSPPPPLPPLGVQRTGPLTAPLPSISQSPGWFNQPYRNPPNAAYSQPPPGFARPATTAEFKNELFFVFDGLNFRR